MTISVATVAKQIRSSRHRQHGAVVTTSKSPTEVDEMNAPLEVTSSTPVVFLWHPTEGAEANDDRRTYTARRTVYLAECVDVSATSKFFHAGVTWEILDVQDWGVGTVLKVARST